MLTARTAVALALGLVVFASRAWLANVWGSPLPFLDEWGVEPPLYRAWLNGTLSWGQLFAPHNEHRIVLTRLADLGLFIVLGQWNPWHQIILNAFLHAASAAALLAMFWPALAPRSRLGFGAGVTLLFCAPSGWQNALFGFQSQVYFTNLLLIAACAGMIPAVPLARRWWLGWTAAFVALFSNAGGGLIAPAVLGATLLAGPSSFRERRSNIARLLLALLFVAALALRVSPSGHVPLHAHTPMQFVATLSHQLSWPHLPSAWMWILLQLPLLVLGLCRWRQRTPLDPMERCAIALFAFAFFHAAAIAYSRGAGLREFQPLSRYQDPLLLGTVAQLFAGLRLAQTQTRTARLMLIGWTGLVAVGLLNLSESHLTLKLPYKRTVDRDNLAAVRAFLTAPADFRSEHEPKLAGLYFDPGEVRRVLEDPVLRPRLPVVLRTPSAADALTPPWIIREGRGFTWAGAAILVILAGWIHRRSASSRPGL